MYLSTVLDFPIPIFAKYSHKLKWTGWYPSLYYGGDTDVEDNDRLVCDVYTNPPSIEPLPDLGCVVHQGLGNPRRMHILSFSLILSLT